MTLVGRVVAAGSAALVGVALLTPPAPAATGTALPAAVVTARATIVAPEPVAVGARVVVRITHLAKSAPVTVSWGDGRTSRRASTCAPGPARRGAERCSRTAATTFTELGSYLVEVRQRGRIVAARTVTVGPTAAAPAAWRTDMLDRVNAVRERAGVEPLSLCAPLTRAAQAYAADMADRGFFDHTSPEGTSPGDRVEAAGYTGRAWGENIAAGQRGVAAVVADWVDSPGHYANLVQRAFTHVGFGRATGGPYGTYWVQNFGAGGRC